MATRKRFKNKLKDRSIKFIKLWDQHRYEFLATGVLSQTQLMEFMFNLNENGNTSDNWLNVGVYLIGSQYRKTDFAALRNILFN